MPNAFVWACLFKLWETSMYWFFINFARATSLILKPFPCAPLCWAILDAAKQSSKSRTRDVLDKPVPWNFDLPVHGFASASRPNDWRKILDSFCHTFSDPVSSHGWMDRGHVMVPSKSDMLEPTATATSTSYTVLHYYSYLLSQSHCTIQFLYLLTCSVSIFVDIFHGQDPRAYGPVIARKLWTWLDLSSFGWTSCRWR